MCVSLKDHERITILNFLSSAAGMDSNVIGTANIGDCYLYSGLKLTDEDYAWFSIAYHNGQDEPVSSIPLYFLELKGGEERVISSAGSFPGWWGRGRGAESETASPSRMWNFHKFIELYFLFSWNFQETYSKTELSTSHLTLEKW